MVAERRDGHVIVGIDAEEIAERLGRVLNAVFNEGVRQFAKFKVEQGRKYVVNVGSVGQPRDNNPKAAYVIYDLDEGSIELRRLSYDIPKAQKKILEAGLPARLAERLADGK